MRIAGARGLVPEQIVATMTAKGNSAVIDQWGRVHRLAPVTHVGRAIGVNALSILHAAVSRRHADLILEADGVLVRDLGSANGTVINNERIKGEDRQIFSGDALMFGGVGFYFCQDANVMAQALSEPPEMETMSSGVERIGGGDLTQPTATTMRLSQVGGTPLLLFEPAGGGGGVAQVADRRAQLGEAQYALLDVLLARLMSEKDKPDVIRGFIRSSELMELLPWDTPHPSDNHLKQLVRRTRRALEAAGIRDLIESKQRFGYRLRLD